MALAPPQEDDIEKKMMYVVDFRSFRDKFDLRHQIVEMFAKPGPRKCLFQSSVFSFVLVSLLVAKKPVILLLTTMKKPKIIAPIETMTS